MVFISTGKVLDLLLRLMFGCHFLFLQCVCYEIFLRIHKSLSKDVANSLSSFSYLYIAKIQI